MKNQIVSVIMPTYNRENYLRYAIDSVLNQTYKNLELHIIDDGSTDGTRDLVNSYDDNRIKYYHQGNRGQSVARNVGIKNASGKFICFLDSDNLWKLDKLERQIKLMDENRDYQIIYGENEIINEDGQVQPTQQTIRRYSGNITEQLLIYNCINFNTTMIRIECFQEMGGINENTRAGEDYELFLKFSIRYRFMYVPEIFAQYRLMENRISSNHDKVLQSNHNILSNFIDEHRNLLDKTIINYTWCRFYTSSGRYHASIGRLNSALYDYLRAILYKPLSKHPWRALAKLVIQRK